MPSLNPTAEPTAAILVIGNEILSGKVIDSNSPFLCKELRALGVDVRRIEVIPDDVAHIAAAVHRMSAEYTHVFTSGGIGPTHDDLTIEGIAAGFHTEVVRDPGLEAMLRGYYGASVNEARLRMANVPRGATVVCGPDVPIPFVTMENVFILPGVPELFRRIFESVRERFASAPFHSRRIYVKLLESDLVDALEQVNGAYAGVEIGSYPRFEAGAPYSVMLTLDGKDGDQVQEAHARLLTLIPAQSVHAVE